ncbi:MAG: PD-(D/E)XK nuclease family protein [Anaerolineae bacterium]|nr:PD-(D/E)XK nuclease family protein [Anaerolineae bacterium]
MANHLYLAPAGCGKTGYLVDRARQAAQDPRAAPRVIVPTRLQARAWRERLARAGGALGVRIGTFDDIYREVLRASGTVVTRLADPVQVRLLRAVIDAAHQNAAHQNAAPLVYYDRIRALPGFVQALRDLIGELKAGGIFPEAFAEAVTRAGAGPRLTELAELYLAYQRRLQQEKWADDAGVGWLAWEALTGSPTVAADWPCVLVDGFDDLTTVQLQVLAQLADRVGQMVVTLTGVADGPERPLVHKRYNHTRTRLEDAFAIAAEPLPICPVAHTPSSLRHLERTLYAGTSARLSAPDGSVTLAAVPDREAEIRTALRWLKTRIVHDGLRPGEVALLARTLEPYRAYIFQTAEEYGLPVRVVDGQPLRSNPAIAALLNLLSLASTGEAGMPASVHLAWRQTVAAWRSPYFDWVPIGITQQDAEALEAVARWGSVIGGPAQWEEAFALLRQAGVSREVLDEDEAKIAGVGLTAAEAEALWGGFRRFCERVTPPNGVQAYRDWVAWVEELVGGTSLETDEPSVSLGIVRCAEEGRKELADRDLAALEVLKDVLRGLVWAEAALQGPPVTFEAFLADLAGAIDAAVYHLPLAVEEDAVLVAGVAQARGIGFRAVAVLGLAEGEFPSTLSEDPFLRDEDRRHLAEAFGLPVDRSPESLEAQIFYEAVTRPREALLLTRPRIADNGAPWEPSPYWEEVTRRLDITPTESTGQSHPTLGEAVSWPELVAAVAAHSAVGVATTVAGEAEDTAAWAWVEQHQPDLCAHIAYGTMLLAYRLAGIAGPIDGDLIDWAPTFRAHFSPHHAWSASRLEQYRTCAYFFFTSSVLGLEPRQSPHEGLDARQLGNIYHHILEQLYRTVGGAGDLAALLEALPAVATLVLDAAPRAEQFRETAFWERTRQGILTHVEQSVRAIESLGGEFRFSEAERAFGIHDRPGAALVVRDGDDSFIVHGLVDRVDRDDAGHVRIVDYKTAGPWSFTNAAVRDGKKLQLPLYALAAQEALGLGQVTEGFYWHVQHAEPSGFTLSGFYADDQRGPRAAMDHVVAMAWEAVRGARAGAFVPKAPKGGCPSYCPAAAYCWHYEASSW